MVNALCVIGHPSNFGGADTELYHQILCWRAMGVAVHVCPTHYMDDTMRAMSLEQLGCIYHTPRDWPSVEGLDCIAFCNGTFLEELPEIKKWARSTTFVNCMTWNFPLELAMHERGLIDFHLYQTDHARDMVASKLYELRRFQPLRFAPYFHAEEFPFHAERPRASFRFGRISRADADKFGVHQLWIYETFSSPVPKEGVIVGWNERMQMKCQQYPPSFVYCYPECGLTQQDFYRFCDAIIMTTDTFENLPRVGFEAMASGCVLIVDRRGGWQLQVEDGVTGWLCANTSDFVYKSTRCASEPAERDAMRQQARKKLFQGWSLDAAMNSWAEIFHAWKSRQS